MKSEWRVTANVINGRKMYAVYRLLDTSEVDHSGNREFASDYTGNRDATELLAKRMNELDK